MKLFTARFMSLSKSLRKWPIAYGLIALVMCAVYPFAHNIIIDQSAFFTLAISNITLSLILLFGLWGIVSDRLTKRFRWSQRTGWIVFFIGLFCAVTFLSAGAGFETRLPI